MPSPFDLRRFAPPAETTFTLRKHGDHVFAVDGDPEVDDVGTMLRIENVIRGRDEGDVSAAFAEGKALLLRMIRDCQPEIEALRIGSQELVVIFSLIVHGSTVAEAVMEAITASNEADAAGNEPDADDVQRGSGDEPEEATVAPLASAKRSSDRSSSSERVDAGLRATGTD